MDCEDGHIAKVISDHNEMIMSGSASITNENFTKTFFPIHFITDYIYRNKEKIEGETGSLAEHAYQNIGYKTRRDEQFRKIGNAFAVYSLMLGRQNLKNKFEEINLTYSSYDDSYKDQFKKIRPFLDAGLGHQAIAVLLTDGIKEIGVNKATVLAMICQKEGYIDSAYTLLEKLKSHKSFEKLANLQKTQIDVTALKVYSQIGSISRVSKLLSDLNSPIKQAYLKEIRQFGAVKRREAICFSLQGKETEAKRSIALAVADDRDRDDSHYRYTNILFDCMAKLPFFENKNKRMLNNVSAKLSGVRLEFLSNHPHENEWQTNFEKGAIAALFLESAYYLKTGVDKLVKKGANILTIAHLFNLSFGGNEVSETYGEIVACCLDYKMKNILSLAMRKDTKSQFLFQKWFNSNFEKLPEIAEAFTKIYRLEVKEREDAIKRLLINLEAMNIR